MSKLAHSNQEAMDEIERNQSFENGEPIMKLSELSPTLSESKLPNAQQLNFLCPACRKRRILVDIWHGEHGDVQGPNGVVRVWHAEQGPNRDWDTLSITPSIDHKHGNVTDERPCVGWHGFITNGIAK